MPPTNLERAVQERNAVKSNISIVELRHGHHTITPITETELGILVNMLDNGHKELMDIHKRLHLYDPDDADLHDQAHSDLLIKILILQGQLSTIQASFPRAGPAPAASAGQSDIMLERLKLPKFNGSILDWVAFRDMFVAAVESNSSFSKVQKLVYLKNHVGGEAERLLSTLSLSEANYDLGWKALTDRYENERELMFAVLKGIFSQSAATSPSSQGIRTLMDNIKSHIRTFHSLNGTLDHIFLYLMVTKIDVTTKELWYQSADPKILPTLETFYTFLEQRSMALSAGSSKQPGKDRPFIRAHHVQQSAKCPLQKCTSAHPIYRCPEFRKLSPSERRKHVKAHRICENCLQQGHQLSSCSSQHKCKTCGEQHNTLLHDFPRREANQDEQQRVGSFHGNSNLNPAILATAVVNVEGKAGSHMCRSLLDGGSSASFITKSCVNRLGLRIEPSYTEVEGLSSTHVSAASGIVKISFTPHFPSSHHYIINALVIDKITSKLPSCSLPASAWNHIHSLRLADPLFHTPATVDMLLGSDIFWELLENEKRSGDNNTPLAIKSTLGWLVAGQIQEKPHISVNSFITNIQLDKKIQRFWESEEVSSSGPVLTPDETKCQQHFVANHQRDLTGRFIVSIPWRNPRPELGSSRQTAIRRFISMEKRLEKIQGGNQSKAEYIKFMREYEDLGHMSVVPAAEITSPRNPVYYIPHHFVLKADSSTTKFRVVFDASAKTTSGFSLNDAMMNGPTVQSPLFDIILRFRLHNVVFTADIAKMYRQILLTSIESDLHRIVWRDSPSTPLKEFRLCTVTYGTASAPYLATRCLVQLAEDEQSKFPLASPILLRDFYVDDVMSGFQSNAVAIPSVHQLIAICASGGFDLRKFTSNSIKLLNSVPIELRETKELVPVEEDTHIKTLGLYWHPGQDVYQFKTKLHENPLEAKTKRSVLSQIAQLFDPIGWLAPVTIRAKILMQDIWKLNIGWDTELPDHIQLQWKSHRDALVSLEKLKIPRQYFSGSPKYHLIGFSDASEKAMAAAVYLCNINSDHPQMALITSKTRVAPAKPITLPRLELNAAVLLSDLISSVSVALKIPFEGTQAFTDSTITLSWIKSDPNKWKTYVRNRVSRIQSASVLIQWFHVRGEINPADCASRGTSPEELVNHPLWWTGSPLALIERTKFNTTPHPTDDMEVEVKPTKCFVATHPELPFIINFSSWSNLVRVTAWLIKFRDYLTTKKTTRSSLAKTLTIGDIQRARRSIIRHVQQANFSSELAILQLQQQLPLKNKLVCLAPFIDKDGVLRVGGRIRKADVKMDKKHPILLPRAHHVTSLIIHEIHIQNLHSGPQLTLAILNQSYWVTRGKDAVRFRIKKCVTCIRHKAATINQMMGDLPAQRINPSRPFDKCGVDYAGPFILKNPGRSRVTFKSWLAIFVCFATRAIHIEVATSLSTDGFIAALRRFISRRGKPSEIHSDCGTNFIGANRKLKEMQASTSSSSQKEIEATCTSEGIKWQYSPPGAPNFGGLWEAGVRSIKHHLHRVIGQQSLTYEEMYTLIVQIEGILNSRPLTPISTDPNELQPLTPAHFLIGASISAIPEPDLMDINVNRLNRWQLLQQKQQQFWKRWSMEYITRLQQRPKWLKASHEFKLNDIVIIKEDNMPPATWKLGRIIRLHPGADKLVRVVTLKTINNEIKRPINKLCLLPISD